MTRHTIIGLLVLSAFSLNGCFMGTMATRTDKVKIDGDSNQSISPFGGIPYSATGSDIAGLQNFNNGDDVSGLSSLYSLISIPMDLLIDTISMPVDLILWPFGFNKNNTPYNHH